MADRVRRSSACRWRNSRAAGDRARVHSPWHAERNAAQPASMSMKAARRSRSTTCGGCPTHDEAGCARKHRSHSLAGVPGGASRYSTGGSQRRAAALLLWPPAAGIRRGGLCIRARRWWGVDVGDREVYLWGAPWSN